MSVQPSYSVNCSWVTFAAAVKWGPTTVVESYLSDFAAPMLPFAAERDPERQQDQPDVESEAFAACVDAIEAELVAAADIARRVNLRDAGEARPETASRRVTWDVLERNERPVTRFDFAGTQRPRSDKAHVAAKDVPELRE